MRRCLVAIAVALTGAVAGSAHGQPRADTPPPRRDLVGRQFDAQVVRIADGDSMEAIPSGEARPVRIRLQGIDAPELGEVFSREAQTFLRGLVLDRRVRVEARDTDRYGRLVAHVWSGGRQVALELVRAGLACHAYARDAALAREESDARRAGRGFWSLTAKKPACVTETAFSAAPSGHPSSPLERGSARPATPSPRAPVAGYRGNTSSGVYHAATCPNANCRNCTRLFTTEAEARAAGFTPAGDCLKR